METRIIESLADIPAAQWNALVQNQNPFLRHEFLYTLERTGCVGERTGWYPHHLLCLDQQQRLLGAMPLYLKDNSFGEFVFDWGWADAYQRHGLDYYPKLVSAVPFTPASGQRLLLSTDGQNQDVARQLLEAAFSEADRLGCSSIHWLFPEPDNYQLLHSLGETTGLMTRLGCHFHWHNQDYQNFDDFMAALVSKKRKNIKRERRLVEQAGISLRTMSGDQVSESEWHTFYRFYSNTFHERGRHPFLTADFFPEVAATMGEQLLLVLASKNSVDVAGAISFKSADTLFGRHWGCRADFDSLHFECCYYQGIEYCIEHGLQRFEPGVQGEHKIWRGFLPTLTPSLHWLAHPAFNEAVGDFLRRENPAIRNYARQLQREHSPYRQDQSST